MISPILLNTIITLQRPFVTIDSSSGAKREAWNPVVGSIDIPASIQSVSSQVRHSLASRQIVITHRIYTSQNLNPKRGDRLTSGVDGIYYLVTGYYNQAGRNNIFMIEGREVSE